MLRIPSIPMGDAPPYRCEKYEDSGGIHNWHRMGCDQIGRNADALGVNGLHSALNTSRWYFDRFVGRECIQAVVSRSYYCHFCELRGEVYQKYRRRNPPISYPKTRRSSPGGRPTICRPKDKTANETLSCARLKDLRADSTRAK